MATHIVNWIAPTPLWGRFAASVTAAVDLRAEDQSRPAILRFASDDFMDQLIGMLATDPKQIGELLARPETWRTPAQDGPDLVERTPLPQPARLLKRMKHALRPAAPVAATTAQASLVEQGITKTATLKLFQPAHQRYYLVAANLVCNFAGFPDRAVANGRHEQVGFVLRRLLPDASENADVNAARHEFAYVKNLGGACWQRVAPDSGASAAQGRLLPGEELLPLFPLNFSDDGGHPRRLLAGLIPVGRREEYMGTQVVYTPPEQTLQPPSDAAAGASPVSARKEQFKMEVAEPWKNLVRTAHAGARRIEDKTGGDPLPPNTPARAATSTNDQLQAQSWLILLDFADYLKVHLRPVWDVIMNPALGTGGLSNPQIKLLAWLDNAAPIPAANVLITKPGAQVWAPSLSEALRRTQEDGVRAGLEGAVQSFPDDPKPPRSGSLPDDDPGPDLAWPGFFYLLAGVQKTRVSGNDIFSAAGPYESLASVPDADAPPDPRDADPVPPSTLAQALRDAEDKAALLDKLVQLVVIAIDDTKTAAAPTPPLPYAARLRDALTSTSGDPGWFVLRCVYERGECGPRHPPVVSRPTQRFQLASFFDPDAPARPIRISLPLDTTPAGMRKFNKNTAFIISDVLCGQIQRAKGLGLGDLVRSVLPWPLHKDLDIGGTGTCKSGAGANIGMICSLSIPIVTICALILLLIIASILDYIFRWLPYLIMCFPIPGLKGKK